MRPQLCVTVAAATMAELRQQRDAVADADLVELRLDLVSDPSVAGALEGRRRPVILTCRAAWEGGGFKGSEEERKGILAEALALGAEYVDVEWRAHFDDLVASTGGRRIVLSSHDFHSVPMDLSARVHAMRSTGAEVVKVAAVATSLSDCIPLLELGERSGPDSRLVLIAMGFIGPPRVGLIDELELALTPRGAVEVDANKMTSRPGVFAAGDIERGQSLVVWAIADGRRAAACVDSYLREPS